MSFLTTITVDGIALWVVILVLILLTVKVASELLFPEFWA